MLKPHPIFHTFCSELFANVRSNVLKCQTAGLKYYAPPISYDDIEFPEETKLKMYDKKPITNMKPRKMKRYINLMRGPEEVHNFLIHKQYGIQALTGGRMKYETFEHIRKMMLKKFDYEKVFALWRVDPPWQAVSKRGSRKKMGGFKGAIHHYVTPLKAGRIILEIGGILHPVEAEKKIAPLVESLPFRARYVTQELLEKEKEEKIWKEENNLNPYTMKYVILNNMGGCNNWLSPYDYKWFGEYHFCRKQYSAAINEMDVDFPPFPAFFKFPVFDTRRYLYKNGGTEYNKAREKWIIPKIPGGSRRLSDDGEQGEPKSLFQSAGIVNADLGVGSLENLKKALLDAWKCLLLYIVAQMLGVLKRRLKPKRPGEKENGHGGRKNGHGRAEPIVPVDMARITSSQRQIHPLLDEKAQLLAYEDNSVRSSPTPNTKRSPEEPLPSPMLHLPKRSGSEGSARATTPGSPATSVYHPAPNICVEGGRIEFIKSPSEGSGFHAPEPEKRRWTDAYQSPRPRKKTTTRAQQTQADFADFVEGEEKCDVAKEFLEARIKELERLLEAEQKSGQRERLAVARLQRQLARREVILRDVDRERRLRTDTETRLRETVVESERYRATLAGLQREFSRMEDTVRTMLQYKSRCEVLSQEKISLATAYENRVHQYQNTISKLNQENESLRHQLRLLETTGTSEIQSGLLERLRSLETENAHISRDADFQRKQYEKCLDDIANQVVRALLSQKGLREEIGNLQRRIKELESQNHALANILVRKLESGRDGSGSSTKALIDGSWFPGTYGGEIRRCSGMASFTQGNDRRCLEDSNADSSFNSLDTLLLPLQRPRSLNLYLHASRIPVSSVGNVLNAQCQHRKSKLNLVHLSKKTTEDEGNESPESGIKDEGYSTMSSDVQGTGDSNELSKRELEDLKEASDETEMVKLETNSTYASVVLFEDLSDPDIFFIPLNFTLAVNPRHSYPPTKDFLPFQHIMRSFSDSHLCINLNPNSPLLTTPFSPSMLLIDLMDKNHPLRRSKATNSLPSKEEEILREMEETQSTAGSWCSGAAEGCWWDPEYIHHCLRFDDIRLKPQKDILQLDYDNTELEDWSLSLSCEDIARYADGESRKVESGSTPGALLSIQGQDGCEVTGGAKTSSKSSYLTVDTKELEVWPYKDNSSRSMGSPGGSWSSVTSNNSDYCCHSLNEDFLNEGSKRSYTTANEDAESSVVGTDFTRDFYRLVKFESTKSLASNSSRSIANGEANAKDVSHRGESNIRESALKNVLNFIAEQQQYCHTREEEDIVLQATEKSEESRSELTNADGFLCRDEDGDAVAAPCEVDPPGESSCTDGKDRSLMEIVPKCLDPCEEDVASAGLDSNRTKSRSKCTNVEVGVTNGSDSTPHLTVIREEGNEGSPAENPRSPVRSPKRHESHIPVPKPSSLHDSAAAAKPPQHRKAQPQKAAIRGTKIPVISTRKPAAPKAADAKTVKFPSGNRETNIPLPTGRTSASRPCEKKAEAPSKVVVAEDGAFHERATSKDVIDELNRMIRKGEEVTPGSADGDLNPLDIACCCPTGWVHVERDIDFTDPKARANLLDVMLASSGSSGGSGSSSDSGGDDPVDYSHLHRIHRFRRQRKACATRKQLAVLRYPLTCVRPSIIGRENFFVRFGEKEREAIASFDFLEDLSTSVSGCSSCDTLGSSRSNSQKVNHAEVPSPEMEVTTPVTPTTPSDDSDERTGGPVSLSDSCAGSYTESTGSLDEQC